MPCELLFVTESILQREHGGLAADEWREQFGKLIVGGCLQADEDELTFADLFRRVGALRPRVEVAFGAVNGDSVAANGFVVRA